MSVFTFFNFFIFYRRLLPVHLASTMLRAPAETLHLTAVTVTIHWEGVLDSRSLNFKTSEGRTRPIFVLLRKTNSVRCLRSKCQYSVGYHHKNTKAKVQKV